MGCRFVRRMGLSVALTTVAPLALAASFDCGQAKTGIELSICASPELSSLDEQLAASYKTALGRTADPEQLRAAQRGWLRDVRGKCQTGPCLISAYKQRLAVLGPRPDQAQATAASPAAAPTSVPPAAPPPRLALETSVAATPSIAQGNAPAPTSGDAIARCDMLAAHPDDPERVRAGIADDKLDAAAAILACEAAAKADPKSPRLSFQLARAYLAADRLEDGVESLLIAAQQGHGGALAYLADLHLGGAPGIEADPVLARTLYEKALASRFEPARKVLAEFEDKTDEYAKAEAEEANAVNAAPSAVKQQAYVNPEIIEAIFARRFDRIATNESWTKEYLVGIAENIQALCEGALSERDVERMKAVAESDHFNMGQKTIEASAMGMMAMMAQAMKDPTAFVNRETQAAVQNEGRAFNESMADSTALFQRHMCGTPGMAQFSKNLRAYVMNDEAPIAAPGAIINACMRDTPPSKYPASQFCPCFGGALKLSTVSQFERRNLMVNFRETATSIMNAPNNRGRFQACRSGF